MGVGCLCKHPHPNIPPPMRSKTKTKTKAKNKNNNKTTTKQQQKQKKDTCQINCCFFFVLLALFLRAPQLRTPKRAAKHQTKEHTQKNTRLGTCCVLVVFCVGANAVIVILNMGTPCFYSGSFSSFGLAPKTTNHLEMVAHCDSAKKKTRTEKMKKALHPAKTFVEVDLLAWGYFKTHQRANISMPFTQPTCRICLLLNAICRYFLLFGTSFVI